MMSQNVMTIQKLRELTSVALEEKRKTKEAEEDKKRLEFEELQKKETTTAQEVLATVMQQAEKAAKQGDSMVNIYSEDTHREGQLGIELGKIGCSLNNITQAKDMIMKGVKEMGFTATINPYEYKMNNEHGIEIIIGW
jgi:hypothetical protein